MNTQDLLNTLTDAMNNNQKISFELPAIRVEHSVITDKIMVILLNQASDLTFLEVH